MVSSTGVIEDVLYSREQAASILKISLSTLERLIESNKLLPKRIGKRVFINKIVLEQYIASKD
jgi:excisionase family DNA binding protein